MWYFPICSHCELINLNELIYLLPHIYIFEVKALEFYFLSNLETHSMLLLLRTIVAILKNRAGRLISAGDVAGWGTTQHSTLGSFLSTAMVTHQSFKTLAFPTGHLLFLLFPTWLHEYRQVQLSPKPMCPEASYSRGCYWARTLQAAQITQPCKCHMEPLPPSSTDYPRIPKKNYLPLHRSTVKDTMTSSRAKSPQAQTVCSVMSETWHPTDAGTFQHAEPSPHTSQDEALSQIKSRDSRKASGQWETTV